MSCARARLQLLEHLHYHFYQILLYMPGWYQIVQHKYQNIIFIYNVQSIYLSSIKSFPLIILSFLKYNDADNYTDDDANYYTKDEEKRVFPSEGHIPESTFGVFYMICNDKSGMKKNSEATVYERLV